MSANDPDRPRSAWRAVIRAAALAMPASLVFAVFLYFDADGASGWIGVLAGFSLFAYLVSMLALLVVAIVRIARMKIAGAAAAIVSLMILVSFQVWQAAAYHVIDIARFYYGRDYYEKVAREKTADGVTNSVRFAWGDTGFAGSNAFHELYYVREEGMLPVWTERCRASHRRITDHFYSVRSSC
jgi:hypothetical protein